ncbi:hypothetical protein EIN_368180 [Entamoeba invadens IP1]|uniref:PPM-type phosphatase domain-containing protein n=1 Tax=Entamoeba invadens IP1 TaxID=370355 RepID=A0A0A1U9M8_ENTIV|nr:hypothetical protein EIN_368180 [Entamoeba invadens IP1]ELP88820.1 hypothetical protein EIN_368180 [Entamoeba invadens IP1]|eukprot:XP_004255591.1 hypothetical protein EIN_368180 [Entamoeba invadens IP1]
MKLSKSEKTKIEKCFDETFSPLISKLPKLEVKFYKYDQPITVIDTTPPPNHYPIYSSDTFSYTSFSTYPYRNEKKMGDPICDKGKGAIFKNLGIFVLGDGCGIGPSVCEAATVAVNTIFSSVIENILMCKNVRDIGKVMVDSVVAGHVAIIESGNLFHIGTSTILLVTYFYINTQIYLLSLSIGDCHALRYNITTKDVSHVVGNLRESLEEVPDCGGRIGPFVDKLFPDLRNGDIHICECNEGDFLVMATDGYHDNFDPIITGKTPKEVSLQYKTWEEAEKDVECSLKKARFVEEIVMDFITNSVSLADFCENTSRYVVNMTTRIRTFMEERQGEKHPKDPHEYPGKCDHTTVMIFKMERRGDIPEVINCYVPSYSITLFGGNDMEPYNFNHDRGILIHAHKPRERLVQTPRPDRCRKDITGENTRSFLNSPVDFDKKKGVALKFCSEGEIKESDEEKN